MTLNPVQASKIDYLISVRQQQYDRIRLLREYADGNHTHILTDDEKVRLVGTDSAGNPSRNVEFHLNVGKTIIDAEVDRLQVRSINITAPARETDENGAVIDGSDPVASKELSALAAKRWKANRLDEGQRGAHQPAIRDGDSYGIVWFDEKTREAKVTLHRAYDGDQDGVDMFYQDHEPLYAVKVWTERETASTRTRRKNIYFADRVEKWISQGGMSNQFSNADWRPLRYGDEDYTDDLVETPALYSNAEILATVEWWTETGSAPQYDEQVEFISGGVPLGLPVFHFRHEADGDDYGQSTIDPVVPGLQDAINDAALSVLVAQKLAGYKVNWATGFDPETSSYTTYPGATIYNTEADGAFGQFSETDLRQLVEVKDTFIKDAATLTATPLTYFNLSGVIPAEGTQQQLELALLAKTRRNQVSFGNAWEDIFRYMLKLEKTWGGALAAYSPDLLAALEFDTQWEPGEVRNDKTLAEIATMHKSLGVPDRYVWAKLGYTEDQIAEFEQDASVKRAQTLGLLADRIAQTEAANNGADPTADRTTNDGNPRDTERSGS